MILVIAGTTEGREIALDLAEKGYKVLTSVVSSYGSDLFPTNSNLEILVQRLNSEQIKQLIDDKNIKYIIDASHPYATEITNNALRAVEEKKVEFIRFERNCEPITDSKCKIYPAADFEEAAEIASNFGGTVFLTIGSKNIAPFIEAGKEKGVRIVARVLPDPDAISKCIKFGLRPRDIIAMQGPFSIEMNIAILKECNANVMVTKVSGKTGGFPEKVGAAASLGIPVVTIERPKYPGVKITNNIEEIYLKAEEMIINGI